MQSSLTKHVRDRGSTLANDQYDELLGVLNSAANELRAWREGTGTQMQAGNVVRRINMIQDRG